jgi:hypothetical protein
MDDAEACPRWLVAPTSGWALDGSGSWEFDALECKDFSELVEVGVAMKQRDTAVLGGGSSDQCTGQRHA